LETAEKIKIALSEKERKPILPSEKEEEVKEEDEINLAELGIDEELKTVSKKTLIEGIIKPRLNEIFTMVGLEIKNSGAAGLTPAGVVICGGGAQTVGVVQAAKKTLAMPIRIGTPRGVTGLIDDIQTPDFAVATGLLLYGASTEGKPSVSFSFKQIGKKLPKIPVGGVANKFWELLKSFLP